jgi:hypothetical protein
MRGKSTPWKRIQRLTPAYDARLEAQFLAVKAEFLGTQGTKKPFPLPLTPIHLIPDSPSGGSNPLTQPGTDPTSLIPDPTSLTAAELLDPNIEPQFNVPGETATMGVPSNFNLFPGGDPSPEDVNQHGVGDCFFDAVLGSLAAQNPSFVKNMVQANPDGTYTVHLFDPNGNRVDVTVNNQLPMDSKGNLVGVCGPNNQANWASIVEKAFAKYNDVYHVTDDKTDAGYAALNLGDAGASGDSFYEALTGVTATGVGNYFFTTPEQQDAFALKMQNALNNGQTVWATTLQPQTMPGGVQIEGSHQYSVIGVNKDADGNWSVDVRNPWGFTPTSAGWDDNTQDGVIRMSMSDYCKYMFGTFIGDKSIGPPGNNGWQPPGGIGPIDNTPPSSGPGRDSPAAPLFRARISGSAIHNDARSANH